MMEIFPAIDIMGGQVVRLRQGDYGEKQVYANDPQEIALRFYQEGARNLHVVDLDGAKEGLLINFEVIKKLAETKDFFVEVGGGIRDEARINKYITAGVDRVILGTVAVRDFSFVEEMVKKYGKQIAVGVDARNGNAAVSGWQETTTVDAFAFCKRLYEAGVETVIYTDIEKDGELQGANLHAYRRLREIPGLNIVASGGISFAHEIAALRDMGTYAAIMGKALYVGKFSLKLAIDIANGKEENA